MADRHGTASEGDAAVARGRGEDGVSLVELVVAIAIFMLLIGGVASTVYSALGLSRENRSRSVAANLASQEMDTVRAANFTTLPIGLVTSTQTVDSVPYTVSRESEWVSTGATAGPCNAQSGSPQLLRVHVSVSWPNMGGVSPATSDTVLSPPVGAYDPNTGHIAVTVRDRDSANEDGATIKITNTATLATKSIITTSDGCAFFAFLPAGSYTVAVTTTGLVDRTGTVSPTQSVSVVVGQVTSVAFDVDIASTFALTLMPPNNETMPNNVGLTLGNTYFLPTGTKAFTFSGSGPGRSVANLFPSLSGYEAWSGTCNDSDPEGQLPASGGPVWASGQRDPALDSSPGVTTTATVRMGAVGLSILRAGVPVANTAFTVQAVHAADSVCASGQTLSVSVTSDANGLVTMALPFGQWTIQLSGKTVIGSWPVASLDPSITTEIPVSVTIQ